MRLAILALAAAVLGIPEAAAQYEVVRGFDDVPLKGPSGALGVVIWNHGVHGNHEQSQSPPPPFVKQLTQAGWDVVRIKRDPLVERGWTTSGLRHVARTVEEVEARKREGYGRIVLAGQSYGGAISLEAARRVEVYAIIPSAPGTGVSATELGSPLIDARGTKQMYDALADGKFERAIGILPFSDEFASGSPERGRRAREIMSARAQPYLGLGRGLIMPDAQPD